MSGLATPPARTPLDSRASAPAKQSGDFATRMCDDMAREGRGQEMEKLVADARTLQESLRRCAPQ